MSRLAPVPLTTMIPLPKKPMPTDRLNHAERVGTSAGAADLDERNFADGGV